MSFIEIAKSRYTTKLYDGKSKISDSEIEKLKEILRLSPSSMNGQPWKFLFISNEEIKNKLAEVSYTNRDRIKDASHLIVFSVIDEIPIFRSQINEHLNEGAVQYFEEFLLPKGEEYVRSWMGHQVYL